MEYTAERNGFMLVFKLLLTPLFVGLISLAGRRWGAQVSGWLVGLPLTSAPITLFLTLEQGTAFAARVAQGTMMGLISQAVFCVIYAWLSFKANWIGCWLVGWGAFFATTLVFEQITVFFPLIFVGVVIALLVALLLWPKQYGKVIEAKPPSWELPGRIVITTGFVLGLTAAAQVLGPHLSGLLAPLPLYATVFAIFSQRFQGAATARQVLHGVIISSFACAVFFLVVAGLIEQWSIVATFSVATLSALLTQGGALWLLRKRTKAAQYKSDQI
jgi:hypothetical protein